MKLASLEEEVQDRPTCSEALFVKLNTYLYSVARLKVWQEGRNCCSKKAAEPAHAEAAKPDDVPEDMEPEGGEEETPEVDCEEMAVESVD